MIKNMGVSFIVIVAVSLYLYFFIFDTSSTSKDVEFVEIERDLQEESLQSEDNKPTPSVADPVVSEEEVVLVSYNEEITQDTDESKKSEESLEKAIWSFQGSSWVPKGVAPTCNDPFVLQSPVDITKVTEALWPGQVRGSDYKGHGGFRFSKSTEGNLDVVAPVGGYLVQASRYLSGGVEQYLLFFSVPCGYFYRFDHVYTLSPELSQALSFLPSAKEGDSRTMFLNPPVWVDRGDLIATQVGVLPDNIFVDFGLYDVRKPNEVVVDSSWVDKYESDIQFGKYGVCFFDFLPDGQGEIMRSLPTGVEGKNSDYCK